MQQPRFTSFSSYMFNFSEYNQSRRPMSEGLPVLFVSIGEVVDVLFVTFEWSSVVLPTCAVTAVVEFTKVADGVVDDIDVIEVFIVAVVLIIGGPVVVIFPVTWLVT